MAKFKHTGSLHTFKKQPEGPGVGGWIAIGFVILVILGQCSG